MGFFNSLPVRITLALVGGIFYSLLTQTILLLFGLSSELAWVTALIVFFFYLVSRFLLLFSGISTPYYWRQKAASSASFYEHSVFHRTAQWVGELYYYHDIVFFIFLVLVSITFLISLSLDLLRNRPIGITMRDFLDSFSPFL
ncbi:MAG: hypothetical protein ACUVWO_14660 [Thermodesulfobacteriota bacterium]